MHTSISHQVYLHELASQQKANYINNFADAKGRARASEVFNGICSFLSKDPFNFPGTECHNKDKGIFICKSYSGIEPLLITIIFQDKPEDSRWLVCVKIVDLDGKILL